MGFEKHQWRGTSEISFRKGLGHFSFAEGTSRGESKLFRKGGGVTFERGISPLSVLKVSHIQKA